MTYAEAKIQRAIVGWLSWALPESAFFTAIGHGGRGYGSEHGTEGWSRGVMWKQMGVRAGVPDLMIAYAGRGWWMEVKTRSGTVSAAQKRVHAALVAAGHAVAVVRSLSDAKGQIAAWGIPINTEKPSTSALKAAIKRAVSVAA